MSHVPSGGEHQIQMVEVTGEVTHWSSILLLDFFSHTKASDAIAYFGFFVKTSIIKHTEKTNLNCRTRILMNIVSHLKCRY